MAKIRKSASIEKGLMEVLKILSDEKYKELGNNAYEFSKEFSWEKIIKKYISLI